ncbi:MAG: hypothetical protein QOH88_3208 [Verrucomicrobiota bacterium]|jgi:hypothetical protein
MFYNATGNRVYSTYKSQVRNGSGSQWLDCKRVRRIPSIGSKSAALKGEKGTAVVFIVDKKLPDDSKQKVRQVKFVFNTEQPHPLQDSLPIAAGACSAVF